MLQKVRTTYMRQCRYFAYFFESAPASRQLIVKVVVPGTPARYLHFTLHLRYNEIIKSVLGPIINRDGPVPSTFPWHGSTAWQRRHDRNDRCNRC